MAARGGPGDHRSHRPAGLGQAPARHPELHKARPPGNAINRIKRNRVGATRYDKLAVRYEATVHVAAINEWLLPCG